MKPLKFGQRATTKGKKLKNKSQHQNKYTKTPNMNEANEGDESNEDGAMDDNNDAASKNGQ